MKHGLALLLLVGGLVGGAAYYGLNRAESAAGPSAPDTQQRVLLAKKFLEQGEDAKAASILKELKANGAKLGEEGQLALAEALQRTGDSAGAAQAAEELAKRHAGTPAADKAGLIRITAALASGKADAQMLAEAEAYLARNGSADGAEALVAALGEAEFAAGRIDAATERLEKVLPLADREPVFRLAEKIGEHNMAALMSKEIGPADSQYEIKRGDSVNRVARKAGVTEELVLACNGIENPKSLRVGQKLKVPGAKFSMHVDIAANTMVLRDAGKFFKLYRVRTGREAGATPAGEFTLLNKKRAPTWRPGNGHVYGPDDPNNELGTRWMSFEGDILGVHGTLHPETIGHYASNGCVGLSKEDVEELFDLVVVGTPLIITGQQDFSRHNVIPARDVPPPQQVAMR